MACSNTNQYIRHFGCVVILFCVTRAVCDLTGYKSRISSLSYQKPVLQNDNKLNKAEIDSKLDLFIPGTSHVTSLEPVELLKLRYRRNSPKRCRKPRLKNGKVRPRRPKNEVYFKCKGKFMLVGSKYAICKHGQWSLPPPVCVKTGCRPPDVDHTLLRARFFYDGAIMSFACPPGYELKGPRSIFCDGTTWNNDPPVCIVSSTVRTTTVSSTLRTTTVTSTPSVTTVTSTERPSTVTSTPAASTPPSTSATVTSTPIITTISTLSKSSTVASTMWTATVSSTPTTSTVASTPTTSTVSSTPTTSTVASTPTTSTVASTSTTTVTSTPWATNVTNSALSTAIQSTTTTIKVPSTLWTRTVTVVPSTSTVSSTSRDNTLLNTSDVTSGVTHMETTVKSNKTTVDYLNDAITPDNAETGYDVTGNGTSATPRARLEDSFRETSSPVLDVSRTSVLYGRTGSPNREHPEQESPASYQKYPDGVSASPSDSSFLDPEITADVYNPDSYDRTRGYEVTGDLDGEYTQKPGRNKHAISSVTTPRNNGVTRNVDTTIRSSLSKSYERATKRQTATLAGLISGIVIVALVIGTVVIVVARWLHQQNVLDLAEVEEFGSVPYQAEEEARNDDLVGTKV